MPDKLPARVLRKEPGKGSRKELAADFGKELHLLRGEDSDKELASFLAREPAKLRRKFSAKLLSLLPAKSLRKSPPKARSEPPRGQGRVFWKDRG